MLKLKCMFFKIGKSKKMARLTGAVDNFVGYNNFNGFLVWNHIETC